jgi:hypothetical protein
MDTRANSSRSTFLHYLCQVVETKYPDTLGILSELKDVSVACRVSFQLLSNEMNYLRTALKDVSKELERYKQTHPQKTSADDKFPERISPFYNRASKLFADLEKKYKLMNEVYEDAVNMFGEEVKDTTSEDFFGIFRTFMGNFEKCITENRAERERENMQEKRKRAEEEKLRDKKKKQKELGVPDISEGRNEMRANLRPLRMSYKCCF